MLLWFVASSGHVGYEKFLPPIKCPTHVCIEGQDKQHNTAKSEDPAVENCFVGGTLDFLSAQDPTIKISV